jgi:hypothetical protein
MGISLIIYYPLLILQTFQLFAYPSVKQHKKRQKRNQIAKNLFYLKENPYLSAQ